MTKPKLILSTANRNPDRYVNLFSASGFRVEAAYLPQNFDGDGLVLCGGGDMDPHFFGEENRGSFPPDRVRDENELDLLSRYSAKEKPIFGICRGMQVLNVFLGGTLVQDLPTAGAHFSHDGDLFHTVENRKDTPAGRLFGERMTVNSAHHQGCGRIGAGLFLMQHHADGTPEGLFGKKLFAVQWHPERMDFSSVEPLLRFFFEMF